MAELSKSRFMSLTGYNWRQVEKAKSELRQEWTESPKGWKIAPNQQEELLNFLSAPPTHITLKGFEVDQWAPHLHIDECVECGTSGTQRNSRHYAKGLCVKCYMREYRSKN